MSDADHEIVAIAPEDEYTGRIPYEFHAIRIKSRSTNPLQHLAVLFRFIRLFIRIKPDIALLYTIQPNTHGNIAARLTSVKTISNIAGLGNLFIDRRPATRFAVALYKLALRYPVKVLFQNNEDMNTFIKQKLVRSNITERIPGSGIDIDRFFPRGEVGRKKNAPFIFLLATRMLWEKGVAEFAEAARRVKQVHDNVVFRLVGSLDTDNPTALSREDMDQLTSDGILEYAGMSDRMENVIALADCVVLPSYREGLPKILLEAAAMAKPIITTNVPGCSDVVENGVTGYLCEVRNAEDLGVKMLTMMELSHDERKSMGEAGHEKAIQEFDQRLVFASYQKAIALCQ